MAEIYNYDQYYVDGTDSDDLIANFTSADICGYSGNDTLISASYVSIMDGGDGDDIIINVPDYGLAAMFGGSGNDTIMSYGAADSTIFGGIESDYETDDDIFIGGAGADVFIVNELGGNDIIVGYDSNDSIVCMATGLVAPPTYFTYEGHVFISGFNMLVCVMDAADKPFNFSYYEFSDDTLEEEDTGSSADLDEIISAGDWISIGKNVISSSATDLEQTISAISSNDGTDSSFVATPANEYAQILSDKLI